MAETTAKYGNYTIAIEESGTVKVSLNGSECINTKAALRDIAEKAGLTIDEKWNTRQAGKKIVEWINLPYSDMRTEILKTMKLIAEDIIEENSENVFTYNQQRAMINRIFQIEKYDIASIMLRLTVIDSLYSTNAAYSYFSIEEMAHKIFDLKTQDKAKEYFDSLLTQNDTENFFNEKYGIRKNLEEGSKQASLMSKYAYYQLLQDPKNYPLGFPIYDSLAIKMYPIVCYALNLKSRSKNKITIPADKDTPNICDYINALNELRKQLFNDTNLYNGLQQFDILDAYLWRMGKIDEGNFSLLLNRNDYDKFVTNLGLENSSDDKDKAKEYAPNLYEKYKDKGLSVNIISRSEKKDKNGNFKITYDFNALVRYEILTRPTNEVVKGLSNSDYISALIEHWKMIIGKEISKTRI